MNIRCIWLLFQKTSFSCISQSVYFVVMGIIYNFVVFIFSGNSVCESSIPALVADEPKLGQHICR
nr:MAG TPA: hypothetical protein [Caudoviricetes sp.]